MASRFSLHNPRAAAFAQGAGAEPADSWRRRAWRLLGVISRSEGARAVALLKRVMPMLWDDADTATGAARRTRNAQASDGRICWVAGPDNMLVIRHACVRFRPKWAARAVDQTAIGILAFQNLRALADAATGFLGAMAIGCSAAYRAEPVRGENMRSVNLWLALAAPLVMACSEDAPSNATCSNRLQAPLVNASSQESYLAVDPAQLAAIVQVTDSTDSRAPLCTGVFVTNEWLVTGAHCLLIDSPLVISAQSDDSSVRRVVERIAHPSLDVALFRASQSASVGPRFRPIPVATASEIVVSVGSVIEIAGYGLTEVGDIRELRFLAEPLVEIDERSFVVDGFGANGACLGDSGGPLLVRERSGPVRVAGVLTSGTASCVGRDRYVRLDGLAEWVSGIVGATAASDETCGGINEEGRCLYGSAMFCEQGRLVAEPCAQETTCGWHPDARGFRCVEARTNPCAGLDWVGACLDGVPHWCNAGALEGEACDCDDVCRIDGKTGGPRCRRPETAAM